LAAFPRTGRHTCSQMRTSKSSRPSAHWRVARPQPPELSVAWLLSHRQVASVIAGATKPEQVQANVAAAGWQLDAEVLTAIDELARAERPVPAGVRRHSPAGLAGPGRLDDESEVLALALGLRRLGVERAHPVRVAVGGD